MSPVIKGAGGKLLPTLLIPASCHVFWLAARSLCFFSQKWQIDYFVPLACCLRALKYQDQGGFGSWKLLLLMTQKQQIQLNWQSTTVHRKWSKIEQMAKKTVFFSSAAHSFHPLVFEGIHWIKWFTNCCPMAKFHWTAKDTSQQVVSGWCLLQTDWLLAVTNIQKQVPLGAEFEESGFQCQSGCKEMQQAQATTRLHVFVLIIGYRGNSYGI